ncbi:MAG: DUF3419 family protein [Alphaproteobacteria bacterium]|nr:DUF3419 family protein [Alphaproteobacteria bacterium]
MMMLKTKNAFEIQVCRPNLSQFSAYSDAYVITNENLRLSMSYMPKKCDNALVVAASGDQPLFCALYGAKHIDTFDISFNAKCIMDIKTAALQKLNHKEYWKLVRDLYMAPDIMAVKNMGKISDLLSNCVFDYLWAMSIYPIFQQGLCPVAREEYALTAKEYKLLQKTIIKPFDFIWSDIRYLNMRLTKYYDFMHFSNIFDYIKPKDRIHILLYLLQYVNVGGKMLMHDQLNIGTQQACEEIAIMFNNWQYSNVGNKINILTRVR